MALTGDVQFTILDGGSVVVPGSSVQVVVGTASSGTVAQVVATQNPQTLISNFGYGPLVEAATLACLAGGTVLALRATSAAAGSVANGTTGSITSASSANPSVITTTAPHNLASGQIVTISGVTVNTVVNGTWVITVLSATTFSVPVAGSGSGSGGTWTATGATYTGTGTSAITVTGTPNDDYFVQLLVVTGGTISTAGITFQVSLDAGRSYGPVLALGTATTYVIPQTGITLNFAAGTLVAADIFRCQTFAPMWNTAGVQACFNALQASQYAAVGWGSMHIAGGSTLGGVPGADATTLQSYLDTLGNGYVFTRAMLSARDAKAPASFGGAVETETTWTTAVTTDYSATSARRICACAGHYNIPSGVPNPTVGAPRYRRPLAWALAARQVQIPPQRHAGRVRDGSLTQISIDPTNDPKDGFIYHDERINLGFDAARFTSARSRIGLPGLYIFNPNLMAPLGSVFSLLPLGNVMDLACNLVHQVGQQIIDADVRLNPNGTIFENEARAIESALLGAIQDQMISKSMISSATVTVDRTTNISTTSTVNINVSIVARGYVLQENVTIGFVNALQAGGS